MSDIHSPTSSCVAMIRGSGDSTLHRIKYRSHIGRVRSDIVENASTKLRQCNNHSFLKIMCIHFNFYAGFEESVLNLFMLFSTDWLRTRRGCLMGSISTKPDPRHWINYNRLPAVSISSNMTRDETLPVSLTLTTFPSCFNTLMVKRSNFESGGLKTTFCE
jgi:hypothetical protein